MSDAIDCAWNRVARRNLAVRRRCTLEVARANDNSALRTNRSAAELSAQRYGNFGHAACSKQSQKAKEQLRLLVANEQLALLGRD